MKSIEELKTEMVLAIARNRKEAIDQVIGDLLQAPDSNQSKRKLLGLDKKKKTGSTPLFEEKGLF